MRHGVLRMKAGEPFEFFCPAGRLDSLRLLQLAQEQIRSRVGGIQVARFEEKLHASLGGSLVISGNTESQQHAHGIRIEAVALGKNLDCWFKCAMKEQLGSPHEKMGLAGLKLRC